MNEATITYDDIKRLYEQACEVGTCFQMIRIGETDRATTQCREELDEVYTPLAKMIDALWNKAQKETYRIA